MKPIIDCLPPFASVFITEWSINEFSEPRSYMLRHILFLLLETVLLPNEISRIHVNVGRLMEKGAVLAGDDDTLFALP